MMRNVCLMLTLLQIIWLRETLARASGAPDSSCRNLTPRHGSALKGTAPFEVTVEKQVHGYKVTLAATDQSKSFEGFIVQGRGIGGKDLAIGNFTVVNDSGSAQPLAHAFQCTSAKDTVTHSSSASKKKVEFLWDPPPNFNGKIQFYATVAENQDDWLKGITSGEISIVKTAVAKPTTAAKTNGTTVDMTTPSSDAMATTSIFLFAVTNLIIVMSIFV